MNTATETMAPPVAATSANRPFFWLVRRELWENKSLYVAPLVAAAVLFVGFLLNAMHLPRGVQLLASMDPDQQRAAMSAMHVQVAMLIILTMAVVTLFYALDALYSERRDRSILFWKSLPVSDTATVLSKLFTAMAAAPAIALVVSVALQVLLLLLTTVVVLISGGPAASIWGALQFFQLTLVMIYSVVVLSLWYAPIYAWLVLVSAWAKKSTFLWAVLPPVAIVLFENIAFGTSRFADLLFYRLTGGLATAFVDHRRLGMFFDDGEARVHVGAGFPDQVLQLLDPVRFLSNPWLWVGLAVAAALTASAVWMRRYREPI